MSRKSRSKEENIYFLLYAGEAPRRDLLRYYYKYLNEHFVFHFQGSNITLFFLI